MKIFFAVLICFLFAAPAFCQQDSLLYHPAADAKKDIEAAVKQAKAEHKYVLIQAGGNWCKWCIEFARFAKADVKIDSVIRNSFVWYHLNYSKENENKQAFSMLDYPQRFGFPVFIILNEKGERLHTQNSEYLEDGKNSYNRYKVQAFLEMWTARALNPKMYGDK
ncbi:MAG: thioredoxin family protein [Ferruginibacter sp.]